MKLNKLFLLAAFGLIFTLQAKAQLPEGFKAEVEIQAIGTTNKVVPFWMRSNQYGSVPLSGASGSLLGRISKDYDSNDKDNRKLVDWGFGFEGRANGGKGSNLTIIEGYLKGRLGVFQLKVGRSKDVMGLTGDTSLSSGSFVQSGNALGIPKVEISIPDYYNIPILGKLFSFKGNFVHGWLGKTKILDRISSLDGTLLYKIDDRYPKSFFHQKSLYVRFGKPDWRLKLYGGFNHQVYWGNERQVYKGNFKLSPVETFFYVATGKTYGAPGVPTSKIGNQIGSIDVGGEYQFDEVNIMLYRQTFYDVGALSKLANIVDGLNGVTISNNYYDKESNDGFQWKKILLELFYSKDQAGYPWSTPTKSGDEDYYNNFYYLNGWSYKSKGQGNPFITTRRDARTGQAYNESDYFINNRVVALHLGFETKYNSINFKAKASYSKNYGTFGTSKYGSTTGEIKGPISDDLFIPVSQLSLYLEGIKALKNGLNVGIAAAVDNGKLLNNSTGMYMKLSKTFN